MTATRVKDRQTIAALLLLTLSKDNFIPDNT